MPSAAATASGTAAASATAATEEPYAVGELIDEALGNLQSQALLREIVDNVERVEVIGEPTWTCNPNLRGLTRIDVGPTPRQRAENPD